MPSNGMESNDRVVRGRHTSNATHTSDGTRARASDDDDDDEGEGEGEGEGDGGRKRRGKKTAEGDRRSARESER